MYVRLPVHLLDDIFLSFMYTCRGYKRFFKRSTLEQSTYLKDDCLRINCTVGVVVSSVECPRLHPIRVPESDMGIHFGMLLENMEGSDIVFDVAGEKFHAHKLVLAARSPIFRSEFLDKLEEGNKEIVVTDVEPKVFKVTFHFILFANGSVLLVRHLCFRIMYELFAQSEHRSSCRMHVF